MRLSGDARAYLQREAAYLRKHSQKAAVTFLSRMQDARENLARFPDMGLEIERLPIPSSRRLIVGDYLLDYDQIGGEVLIISIRHSLQQPPAPEIEKDFDYEVDHSSFLTHKQ